MGVERPDEGKVLMNYNGNWIENTSALELKATVYMQIINM